MTAPSPGSGEADRSARYEKDFLSQYRFGVRHHAGVVCKAADNHKC
jgi:hypothetical protein